MSISLIIPPTLPHPPPSHGVPTASIGPDFDCNSEADSGYTPSPPVLPSFLSGAGVPLPVEKAAPVYCCHSPPLSGILPLASAWPTASLALGPASLHTSSISILRLTKLHCCLSRHVGSIPAHYCHSSVSPFADVIVDTFLS